jgi:hypothetical protein
MPVGVVAVVAYLGGKNYLMNESGNQTQVIVVRSEHSYCYTSHTFQ